MSKHMGMQYESSELEDRFARHLDAEPQIDSTAYVAPGAHVIGDVRMAAHSSVWPGCVLRGDINSIEIGEGSNIQDGTVVHLSDDYGVKIGKLVTVGHMAMIHACTIEDECLIGMKATVLDGAVIGRNSIIGAGALVTKGMQVPPGSLVMGLPAKVVKTLDAEAQSQVKTWAEKYVQVAAAHKARLPKES